MAIKYELDLEVLVSANNDKSVGVVKYMLVERSFKVNRAGYAANKRVAGNPIPFRFKQVGGTNIYSTLSGAVAKRKAILADDKWGYSEYSEGEIKIAKVEITKV